MAKTLSPLESFLAPLARVALKHPAIEAEVIWANEGGWESQDDTADLLDGEEIAFYAEGLLLEGFRMQYQILAETEAPEAPVHIRLFFWESGAATPPKPESGLCLTAAATWNG